MTLAVDDRTPRFLAFHRAAALALGGDTLTEPQCWALWRRMYGFAAVPPRRGR